MVTDNVACVRIIEIVDSQNQKIAIFDNNSSIVSLKQALFYFISISSSQSKQSQHVKCYTNTARNGTPACFAHYTVGITGSL